MRSETADERGFRVLFVCTGNTCRSPMAAELARRELRSRGIEGVEVLSAGTAAAPGSPASLGALRAAERHGLDLSGHRSTPLTAPLVESADLVLAMSTSHLSRVAELTDRDRASLLGAFAEGGKGAAGPPVPDPFGGGDDVYEQTFRALDGMVALSIGRLEPLLAK